MYIKNTSRYDTAQVSALVNFAMEGLDFEHDKLVVNVKNCNTAGYRGRAYHSVPPISPFYRKGYKWLVTIGVGQDKHFPCDNEYIRYRKEYVTDWITFETKEQEPVWGQICPYGGLYGYDYEWNLRYIKGPSGDIYQYRFYKMVGVVTHYGGDKSPLIRFKNWHDALVGVAAHEGRHIVQFQHKKPIREHECETAALAAITRWNALVVRNNGPEVAINGLDMQAQVR